MQKGLFEMDLVGGGNAENDTKGDSLRPLEQSSRPLADLIRPGDFKDIFGQEHLLGEGGYLNLVVRAIDLAKNQLDKSKQRQALSSLILWGPAGVGKTSIARILARMSDAEFVIISAINSATVDIKRIFQNAQLKLQKNIKTLLMIDEIHHFNKTQQDLFLPYIEDGTIILIATTTENPSFHLNSALLSRCKVLTLKALDDKALGKLMDRLEGFLGKKLLLDKEARLQLISLACGDGRYLLNTCQELLN